MPRYPIYRSTNFIVEEESWMVVEYDHTSVPGIIYISLTENKINAIYDDVENNIADLDKLARYELLLPEDKQLFNVSAGDTFSLHFTLTKNGIPNNEPVSYISNNKKVVKVVNNELVAIGEGEAVIELQLMNYPNIKIEPSIPIEISFSKEEDLLAYISGPDSIKLNRKGVYTLISNKPVTNITFTLEETNLAFIKECENNTCEIWGNNKNILGDVILKVKYFSDGIEKILSKKISIIPLW